MTNDKPAHMRIGSNRHTIIRKSIPTLTYKAFKFGKNNEFIGSHNLVAADDADAILLAELVVADCKVDIWDGARFVECIEP